MANRHIGSAPHRDHLAFGAERLMVPERYTRTTEGFPDDCRTTLKPESVK
jgi:hypothetical protein